MAVDLESPPSVVAMDLESPASVVAMDLESPHSSGCGASFQSLVPCWQGASLAQCKRGALWSGRPETEPSGGGQAECGVPEVPWVRCCVLSSGNGPAVSSCNHIAV